MASDRGVPTRVKEAMEEVGISLGIPVAEQEGLVRAARREIGEYEARQAYRATVDPQRKVGGR